MSGHHGTVGRFGQCHNNVASDVDNGSNDACNVSLSADPTAFTCSEVGGNTVTLTVTDDNGNGSSCTSTVTVEDNIDPIALCQDYHGTVGCFGQCHNRGFGC